MDEPKLVLVMRHAEKPADPLNPNLSEAGLERAKSLVEFIPKTFGRPNTIVATAISKHSERPLQTVQPLAQAVNLKINDSIADQDYPVLAQQLLAGNLGGPTVVVCWHHGHIPSLMSDLGAPVGSYPDPWDPDVFNLILRIDYVSGVAQVSKVIEPF